MADSDDPAKVYSLNPEHMTDSIAQFLSPVITKLENLASTYATAQTEVKTAYDAETPGWFGGEGNGELKIACRAFMGELRDQLAMLVTDQNELTTSLQDYRSVLFQHIQWAQDTDAKHAEAFRAIERGLDAGY